MNPRLQQMLASGLLDGSVGSFMPQGGQPSPFAPPGATPGGLVNPSAPGGNFSMAQPLPQPGVPQPGAFPSAPPPKPMGNPISFGGSVDTFAPPARLGPPAQSGMPPLPATPSGLVNPPPQGGNYGMAGPIASPSVPRPGAFPGAPPQMGRPEGRAIGFSGNEESGSDRHNVMPMRRIASMGVPQGSVGPKRNRKAPPPRTKR
jgi:hypothetical protein